MDQAQLKLNNALFKPKWCHCSNDNVSAQCLGVLSFNCATGFSGGNKSVQFRLRTARSNAVKQTNY